MKKLANILIPIFICFLVGLTANFFKSTSIHEWYPHLNKPSLTPPNIVFPIAWTFLYICMGLSIGLIISSKSSEKKNMIWLFIIQLFFNFSWSILFFYLRNPLWGLANIIILDIAVIYYTCKSFKINKISSALFFPYILWLIFATYLNLYIFWYN